MPDEAPLGGTVALSDRTTSAPFPEACDKEIPVPPKGIFNIIKLAKPSMN